MNPRRDLLELPLFFDRAPFVFFLLDRAELELGAVFGRSFFEEDFDWFRIDLKTSV
jgi:hypothetical protein